MKPLKIFTSIIIFCLLIGCNSTYNKILGIIELNKTTRDELFELNLKNDSHEVWDNQNECFEYVYVWDYADYTLNNVNGIIRIHFENKTAQCVNFSADATKDNMEKILSYLVDTYGDDYEEIDDYTTRWTSDDLFIAYALTDENTVEIRWYIKE